MDRFFTPLLRKAYALLGIFAFFYAGFLLIQSSSWNKERLYRTLLSGSEKERASAGFDLAYLNGEAQLVRALKSPSPEVRLVAANCLWRLWARAGGHQAFRQVEAASSAVGRNAYPEALAILTQLTKSYPKFPEGWNRRATLLWEMGRYQEAIVDANRAVALNPNHFGAWQGMGLCHAHLGELEEACRCMRTALRITPHDPALRKLLDRCQEVLERVAPRPKTHSDLI